MPVEPLRRRARVILAMALPVLLLTACSPAPAPIAAPASAEPVSAAPAAVESSAPPPAAPATSSPAPTTAAAHPTTAAPARTRGHEDVPANDASRLKSLPANTSQVVVVQSASQSATTGTLQAYAKSGGAWRSTFGPVAVHLGGNGFSDRKHEGDRTTPAGVFAIDATMYGIAANPGVRYGYHRLVADDWWDENSDSPGYNTFSHGPNPGGPSEALWQVSPQYTYFAVIRYNMPATAGRGSGIFLHQSNGNSTLGCVSLPQADLLTVLRWLDPAANPRIVMAPTAWLSRY